MSAGIEHRPLLGLGAGPGNERSTFERPVTLHLSQTAMIATCAGFQIQRRAIERLQLEGTQAGGAARGDVYGFCCDRSQAAV